MHKLYTDGTYNKNLYCAGIGGFIRQQEKIIFNFNEEILEHKHFDHHEHVAVIYGLEKALEMNIQNIKVYSDMDYYSKYLNNDLNNFKPKNKNSINCELVLKIIALAKQFSNITFCYVQREKNTKAHKLASKIYEKRRTKVSNSLPGFPIFLEPSKTIDFFTFKSHVEIKLTDLASLEIKTTKLMRYPFKKDIVDTIKNLTKDFPPEEKINFYLDQESYFLKEILFN